ncbi:hypothetical protein DLD82_09125 [Methanospirillum stamsii]|uniref:DUF1622 domain-containing protein n=2 Tax=Methanospirillum stamsii TaxID=1277351 RepID=A0A2V2N6Q1_9EURY|nr:hypothetical protein DLD82_09125 [Methanospirillum stamsii]
MLVCIEIISQIIEIIAVIIIFGAVISGSVRYLYQRYASYLKRNQQLTELRQYIGQWLLLGLELLVAADVIRTVALDQTLESVAGLGLLVLVRTFLSWALVVEMEGRWPWQH